MHNIGTIINNIMAINNILAGTLDLKKFSEINFT